MIYRRSTHFAANADPELKSIDGETALTLAESIGQIRIVELLGGLTHAATDDALK